MMRLGKAGAYLTVPNGKTVAEGDLYSGKRKRKRGARACPG
jgi:hypothetical protein